MAQAVWSQHQKAWVIEVILKPFEAEAIAAALGYHDGGAQELLAAAAEAHRLTEEDWVNRHDLSRINDV